MGKKGNACYSLNRLSNINTNPPDLIKILYIFKPKKSDT